MCIPAIADLLKLIVKIITLSIVTVLNFDTEEYQLLNFIFMTDILENA